MRESSIDFGKLERAIDDMSYPLQTLEKKTLEEGLLKTIVGTSRTTRLGPTPSPEAMGTILSNIELKTSEGEPLEVVVAWGAMKTIAQYPYGVDLAELLTIRQFVSIDEAIKRSYPPGVSFNIFLSDSYYGYLYGEDPRVDEYSDSMLNLVAQHDNIKIKRMSDIQKHDDEWNAQIDRDLSLLRDYWQESSEEKNEKCWNGLASYHELTKADWLGVIPQVTRDFYLHRMELLFPGESFERRTERVLKFFAYGLLLRQNDIFTRRNPEKCTMDLCLLRVPPPGMPKELHGNRLRIRALPYNTTNKSAPPWTIAGTILSNEEGDFLPSFLSTGQLMGTILSGYRYKGMVDVGVHGDIIRTNEERYVG